MIIIILWARLIFKNNGFLLEDKITNICIYTLYEKIWAFYLFIFMRIIYIFTGI